MSTQDWHALHDTVMRDRIREIVHEQNVQVIVETGINHGLSTVILADMVPLVFGIDNDIGRVALSHKNYMEHGCQNKIVLCAGNSPDVLKALCPILPNKTIYFLDAHWQDYWPLLDEIRAIRKRTGILILHDMNVPDHPELGYDTYNGKSLCYEYVKDALTEWSPSHRIEYNNRVEGTPHARGIGYVFPE